MRVLRRAAVSAWIVVLAGCASQGVQELHPLGIATGPRPRSEVRFYTSASEIPFAFTKIAIFTPRQRAYSESTLEPFMAESARRGGNALFLDNTGRRTLVVAAYVDSAARRQAVAPLGLGGTSDPGAATGGCTGSCPVHVRGYTRKDGTYVQPHTRSAPGTRGGRRP